jgi:transposase-like protein
MTTRKQHKTKLLAVEAVADDRDRMKALMKEAFQEMLEGEVSEFLGAAPGERTESRTGYRAGYYSLSLITRIGKLEMRVPRERSGEFSTGSLHEERESAGGGALASTARPDRRCDPGATDGQVLRAPRC